MQHENIQHKKYNIHVQIEVELSSPKISIMDKVPKQKFVEIRSTPFQNDDPTRAQLDNTGKSVVALQPKSPLHYVVYAIIEANSSTTFNLLIRLDKNRWWVINVINDGG